MPVKIFFCYAHEDEKYLNMLKAHLRPLQRQDLIDVWHDRDITAGTEWEREIDRHLNSADIILLLISPDFMNSNYIQSNTAYVLLSGNSPFIKIGLNQPNTLTAIARGSSMSIFINRQYVGTATDSTYKSGIIGLIAQTLQQSTEVAFSNAEVWTVQ